MSKVKVDELTIEGIVYVPKDSQAQKVVELNGQESLWEIGKNYLL